MMEMRGFSVEEVRDFLSLGCVQTIYHWFEGISIPTLDNLYALSDLLQVPMDMLVVGDSRKSSVRKIRNRDLLMRYYTLFQSMRSA